MSYNLFLDDFRIPDHAAEYILPVELKAVYTSNEWVIVRDYNEFVQYIEQAGLPQMVSFDHDLAQEHYEQFMFDTDKEYNDYCTDGNFKEKTGFDCAKWLLNYIKSNDLLCPLIYCHSMNTLGKENILNLFADQNCFILSKLP